MQHIKKNTKITTLHVTNTVQNTSIYTELDSSTGYD